MKHSAPSTRSNALWGRGSRGDERSNALWGRGGGRTGVAVLALCTALMLAAGAAAGNGNSAAGVYLPGSLSSAIQQNPKQSFDVILQGNPSGTAQGLLAKIASGQSGAADERVAPGDVEKAFTSIDGVRATLTGKKIQQLVKHGLVDSIVPNEPVKVSGLAYSNQQIWPWAVGAVTDWTKRAPDAPTIAVVDSGVDGSRSDFGSNFLGQVNLSTLTPNATGDGDGHGTFVAGIAAGTAPGHAGVAPTANILSIRVMDNQGMANVSDVIAACDWILANKAQYNIRVANFSLHSANRASMLFDPLDRAVEKLWLNGVIVVAAAGNYGTGSTPSGVQFAPGNDPFVITVGAADIGAKIGGGDDTIAPFSAWGYTGDGFMKPDVGGPGRYMIGPVSSGANLYTSRPNDIVSPGYMQLSGTSFSSPVVAGVAAMLLAAHPSWTPDQIKAVIMMTATPEPLVPKGALGVGDVNVARARTANPNAFPNPNAGLDQFLTTDASGLKAFDSAAWQSTAQANVAWNSVAWSSAAWSSAAWSSAAWSSVAWSSAAWSSVAWSSAAWSDAAWSDAAWSDAAWSDAADGDVQPGAEATAATDTFMADALAAFGIVDDTCDPTLSTCAAPGTVDSTLTATTSTISP
jgi:serine protease AprX